jgi:hypothetical protein
MNKTGKEEISNTTKQNEGGKGKEERKVTFDEMFYGNREFLWLIPKSYKVIAFFV